jgi:hypothetical protein
MINMESTVVDSDELAAKGDSWAWDSMTILREHAGATLTWSLGLESVTSNDRKHHLNSLTQPVDSEHSVEEGSD